MSKTGQLIAIVSTLAVSGGSFTASGASLDRSGELKKTIEARLAADPALVVEEGLLRAETSASGTAKDRADRLDIGFAPSVANSEAELILRPRDRSTTNNASRSFSARQRIRFEQPSLSPTGFIKFCFDYPQECRTNQRAQNYGPIKFEPARWAELMAVNRKVNAQIVPQSEEAYTLSDSWVLAPKVGNCKDYAVTKRHELLARGWPPATLLLTEVVVASGQHHLLLVVRTSDGDFALDNLVGEIRPVAELRYRWIRAQHTHNAKLWSAISIEGPVDLAMVSQ